MNSMNGPVYEITLYQVKMDLMRRAETEMTEMSVEVHRFLISRLLRDDLYLNPLYYEKTNKILIPHRINGVEVTKRELLNYIFKEFNTGELRNSHPSYSLSISDVIQIDDELYRVCATGFEPFNEWDAETLSLIPKTPVLENFKEDSSEEQLSMQTTELRQHQDIEFDVFVYPTPYGHTFLEGYSEHSWHTDDITEEDVENGFMYPAYTNISPFHLRQGERYIICYIDDLGVHHAYPNLSIQEIEDWLSEPIHKVAYKDGYASIYQQTKCLSLSAYCAFLELH